MVFSSECDVEMFQLFAYRSDVLPLFGNRLRSIDGLNNSTWVTERQHNVLSCWIQYYLWLWKGLGHIHCYLEIQTSKLRTLVYRVSFDHDLTASF